MNVKLFQVQIHWLCIACIKQHQVKASLHRHTPDSVPTQPGLCPRYRDETHEVEVWSETFSTPAYWHNFVPQLTLKLLLSDRHARRKWMKNHKLNTAHVWPPLQGCKGNVRRRSQWQSSLVTAAGSAHTKKMPWDTKTKECLCQIWLHCWSGVSRSRRYSATLFVCVCICVVSGSGRHADEMWPILDADLPNTPGKQMKDFLEPPSHGTLLNVFPKELSCCVTMEINDCECWNALIIVENKLRVINYPGKLLLLFSAYSVFHYWDGEGKDPKSPEVCGEKLM